MKKFLIIGIGVLITGCGISNQEIVDETRFCEENGMETTPIYYGITASIIRIQCTPIPTTKPITTN